LILQSLRGYHTFRCDVPAEQIIELSTVDEAIYQIRNGIFRDSSTILLGGGSNVLFLGEKYKTVVLNRIMGRSIDRDREGRILFHLGAGETWHDAVKFSLDLGYNGLENLALIPGTCGAAPIQNIGAYGVELKDLFISLEVLDKHSGQQLTFNLDGCQFGYRNSIFKNALKDKYLIISITVELQRNGNVKTAYGDILKTLKELNFSEPFTPLQVFNAVVKVRQSKLPDPNKIGNAGSFFKNPEISSDNFRRISSHYPDLPGYPLADGMIKVPAGWLIEQCGFKGYRVGDVGTYEKQALVIINYGNGTGSQIEALAATIQNAVYKKFEIHLNAEVNYL